jgi:hypothetical protein
MTSRQLSVPQGGPHRMRTLRAKRRHSQTPFFGSSEAMLPSEGRYLSEAPFVRSTTLGECLDLLLASLAKLEASTDKGRE